MEKRYDELEQLIKQFTRPLPNDTRYAERLKVFNDLTGNLSETFSIKRMLL